MNSHNENEKLAQNNAVELNDEMLEKVIGGNSEHGGRDHDWHPGREGGWGHGHYRGHGRDWDHRHGLRGVLGPFPSSSLICLIEKAAGVSRLPPLFLLFSLTILSITNINIINTNSQFVNLCIL